MGRAEVPNLETGSGPDHRPRVFLDDNESGRFYSGFNTIRIERADSIMLKGMADAVLGVWCSHGEGKNPSVSVVSVAIVQCFRQFYLPR